MAAARRLGLRDVVRAVFVGFASLFGFGDADRHFSEVPEIIQPVAEEREDRGAGEPE